MSPALVRAIAVVALLLLAGWLRLWHLDLVEFRNDEGLALRLAENMVRLGQIPLVGLTSSLGVNNPPHFIYFLAPFVGLARNPQVATAAVGLANLAGVGGVVMLGWRSFPPLGGLVAGLAYATHPWAVFYARKVWAQDILAPLAVLLFIGLDRAVISKNVAWAVATLPIFAIGFQVHFSFGMLAPLLIAPVWVLLVHRHVRQLLLGVGLAALTTIPYILAVVSNGWADLGVLQHLLTLPAMLDGEGFGYVLGLATGWDNWYVGRIHLDRLLPGRVAAVAANIETILVWLGVGTALIVTLAPGAGRRARRLRHSALLLWLLLPGLFTLRHAVPLFEHYFLFVPPAAALLIAAGVQWLGHLSARWSRPLLGLALGGLLLFAAIQTVIVVRLLNRVAVEDEPSYGPPLAFSEQLAQELASFGATGGSQHLAIEFWGSDSEAIAYLTRPFFPKLEMAIEGQIGLESRSGSPPMPSVPPPPQRLLAPVERLDLSYADGVKVLSAVTSSYLVPSNRINLAITWI